MKERSGPDSLGAIGIARYFLAPVIVAALSPFLTTLLSACLWSLVILLVLWKASSLDRPFAIFLFLLAVLSLFRFEAFLLRPYWDSILGCFSEATFLLKHHFNYSLLTRQESYLFGGPKVYVLSLYPTYLALLMKLIPSPDAFLPVVHFLGFAAAAMALTAFFRLLHGCFDRGYAVFGLLLLLMDPLFLAQAEAINMEILILMASLLGLSALLRHRTHAAFVFSLLAVLLKGSGIVFSSALLGTYVLVSKDKRSKYYRRIVLLLLPILLFVAYLLYIPVLDLKGDLDMGLFTGTLPMIDILRRYLPLTYAVSIVLSVFALYTGFQVGFTLFGDRRLFELKDLFGRIRDSLQWTNPVLMFSLLYLLLFYLFHLQFSNILPRYFLLQAPFLIIALLYVVRFEFINRGFRLGFLLLCLCWSLANIRGDLLEKDFSSNGHHLEHTLAYEEDLRFQSRLAKYLEHNYGDRWIVTSWPMTQILSLPQLGYVEKPLKVITARRPCRYCESSIYLPELGPAFEWKDSVACFPDNVFSGKDAGLYHYDFLAEFKDAGRKAEILRVSPKMPR
jgi:hypothetical protein